MIPNCKGCEEERMEAINAVINGYHIATAIGREYTDKRHYCILIVDDKGKIIIN